MRNAEAGSSERNQLAEDRRAAIVESSEQVRRRGVLKAMRKYLTERAVQRRQ